MQNITIFSLGKNISTMKDKLEKSIFLKKIFYRSTYEIDLMLKNRGLLNLDFLKEYDEACFAIKHEILVNYEFLVVQNDLLKFQLINYIKEAKGVVNITTEQGFDNDSFVIILNLAKIFDGIIFIDGVMINSDGKVLMNLQGETETTDFIGKENLFPMDSTETNAYLDVLDTIPMEITKYIPMVKIQGKMKSKEEILKRALALLFIATYAESLEKTGNIDSCRNFLFNQSRKYQISGTYSENELDFIFNNKPLESEIKSFSREYEASNILLWALNLTEEFSFPPISVLSPELISKCSKYLNFDEIIVRALIKDEDYILKNYDINHKILRSALDNKFSGKEIPSIINLDILESREKAFKWITSTLDWNKIWGNNASFFAFLLYFLLKK